VPDSSQLNVDLPATEERLTMERTEVLDWMGALKLYGMEAAYDETLATALKRKHEPQRFVGDLSRAERSVQECARQESGPWGPRRRRRQEMIGLVVIVGQRGRAGQCRDIRRS
jgi:hypothetical protein